MYLSNLNTMSRDPYWWSSSANEAPKEERWPGGLLATLEEPTKYRNQLEDALRVINTDDDSYRFDERDGFDERGGLISRVESGRDKWQAKITIRHQPETAIIIDETLPQGQIKYSLNVDLSSYQKSIYNLKIVFNKLEEILAFPEAAEMPHEKFPNFIDQSVLYSTRPKIIIEQHPEIFFQPNPESGYRLRTKKSSLVPYHVPQRNEETVLLRPLPTYRESMLDPNNHPKVHRVLIDGYILKEWIIHMKKK